MLLLIDNYDSFTYNLVQYFLVLGESVQVVRNDECTLQSVNALNPNYIVISPGPGNPNQAGMSLAIIDEYKGKVPILGVCLGHQAIAQTFGAKIIKAERMMHGKTSDIEHNETGLFTQCPSPMTVTRYHSLVVQNKNLPTCLEILAVSKTQTTQEIMALKHRKFSIWGVQFHPESIASQAGYQLLRNFLNIA